MSATKRRGPGSAYASAFALVSAVALAFAGTVSYISYRYAAELMAVTSSNEAALIARRLGSTLERVSGSAALCAAGAERVGLDGLGPLIELGLSSMPEVFALRLYDAEGRLLAGAGREAFSAEADAFALAAAATDTGAGSGFFYSDALRDPGSGRLGLLALSAPTDSFRLLAVLDLGYFEGLFSELELGATGMASVRRADTSRLVVRHPRVAAQLNNPAPDIPPQLRVAAGERAGVVRYVGRTDGVDRVFAFRAVDGYPFYALVGRGAEEQYAGWRWTSAAAAGFALLTVVGFAALLRSLRRRDRGLASSEARYRSIVEAQPDAVCRTTMDGSVSYANARFAALFGLSDPAGLVGRRWADFLQDDRRASLEAIARRIAEGGEASSAAIELLEGGKVVGVIDWAFAPIRGPDGAVAEIQAIGRDLSERARLEERLRDSLAVKEGLLRELSHRVRNTMQLIGSLIRIHGRLAGDGKAAATLRELDRRVAAVSLAYELVGDSPDRSSLELGAYLRGLAAATLESYGRDDGSVRVGLSGEAATVILDEALPLGLALGELISNSCRHAFGEGGGSVEIRLEALEDGRLALSYADSGPGLGPAAAVLAGGAAGDLGLEGGLGLSLAAGLVRDQLGGEIQASPQPGARVRFIVRLGAYKARV